VTEQFDETLLLLKRTFGWRYVLYRRQNVTRSRPARAEVPAGTLEVLEERNQLDRALHTYARELLREQIARQDVGFAIELEAFRRVNSSLGNEPADAAAERVALRLGFRRAADRLRAALEKVGSVGGKD
jgi:hypothetical protein